MDIVLEIVDTFVFDYCYAALFPALPGLSGFKTEENSTIALNNFKYTPASQYISVSPYQYAYTTSWPRDNTLRQFISLYLIVLFVILTQLYLANH